MIPTTQLPNDSVAQLPATFAFSQSSLQAYEDCARRFWLAYVQQLPWPAVEAAPVQDYERHMRLGATFHLLVQRAEIGMDVDQLRSDLEAPLAGWLTAYLRSRPADLPTEFVEIEHVLSIPFAPEPVGTTAAQSPAAYRLAAKYDLVAAESDGRVVIIDWKTTRRRTDPGTLRRRLQTMVYPYVLVEASKGLPWGPVQPEQVEMRYWFTAAPDQPVVFRYDSAQHAANHERLQQLLAAILAGQREADFPKIADTEINRKRFCSYCIYRSRCNRGVTAGDLEELGDTEDFFAVDVESALEFTLEEVDELAF
ncbi:MAG: PD-(D/E)XK nuclease family protein [Caldilineaceae bacterium]|nr:PD-(D/E)XK nuclease family protein [Caldilineaceae bacterium]